MLPDTPPASDLPAADLLEPEVRASGYLTARAYLGSLMAFVIVQDVLGLSAVERIDPAEYIHHLATLTARGLGVDSPGDKP